MFVIACPPASFGRPPLRWTASPSRSEQAFRCSSRQKSYHTTPGNVVAETNDKSGRQLVLRVNEGASVRSVIGHGDGEVDRAARCRSSHYPPSSRWRDQRRRRRRGTDLAVELAVLLPGFVSVSGGRFADRRRCCVIGPTVSDAFTSAAISRVALAFGARVPMVHAPVELSYVVYSRCRRIHERESGRQGIGSNDAGRRIRTKSGRNDRVVHGVARKGGRHIAVFVIEMSASIAPPPPPQLLVQAGEVTVTVTLEEVLPPVLVVLVDSPTMPVFVISCADGVGRIHERGNAQRCR